MRKLLYFLPVVLLFGVGSSGAQERSPGQSSPSSPSMKDRSATSGAKQSAAPITSVQSVKSAKDDQPVKLRGKIVSKKSGNEYVFSDGTGNVDVEIGSRALKGKNDQLRAGTEVEIVGEVDTRRKKEPKVEAKSVTILAAAGGASGSAPMSDSPSSRSPASPGAGGGSPKKGY
jgi:uncharacterized protein (TIGR00156 family)